MSKYTPGPWRICGAKDCKCRMIWSGDGEACISVAHGDHWKEVIGDPWPIDDVADANARLIAAAPELLVACKALLACSLPTDVSGRAMVDLAVAAIAKAEATE